jgi:metal-sulfur cluster biosynthetic enzyme
MNDQRLWAALSEVQDPEMPVNLVDLGVIYAIAERDGVVEASESSTQAPVIIVGVSTARTQLNRALEFPLRT